MWEPRYSKEIRVHEDLVAGANRQGKVPRVFRRARIEGLQLVTRQDKEGVVMISDDLYW